MEFIKRLGFKKTSYSLILVIGILLYFRVLFFGYTYLDDNVLIIDNLFYLKNPANLFRSFTIEVFHVLHSSAAYYRPLLTISYMFDSWFSGESPFVFHLTSILIHILNSVLLLRLLLKLQYQKNIALIASLVFVVHPVFTQAVVWIPGRNDTLLTLFALVSFHYFLSYLDNFEKKDLYLHLAFISLAFFTKESALILPFAFTFYCYLVAKKKINWNLPFYWFLVGSAWFLLRSVALAQNPVEYKLGYIIASMFSNSPAILLYLGKLFFPFNLSVLPTLQDSTLVWGVIALALMLILAFFRKNKNYWMIVFGAGWFILFLITSFVRPNTNYVADFIEHRVYLPSIGFLLVFLGIIPENLTKKRYTVYLFVVVIIVYSIINVVYQGNFKDRLSFWKNAVMNSPSHPLAHKNLGAMYYLDGNLDEAYKHFNESLRLNPDELMVHNNLGLIYFRRGDNKKAEEEYKKELELNPAYDNAYYNWGLLFQQEGKLTEAVEKWLITIKINPDHVGAYTSLGIYYKEQGDLSKASYYLNEARKRGVKI